jgi:hypothetical protein
MEGRVDEVGPDFETLDAKAAPVQSRHDSSGDRGLAGAAMRTANDNNSSFSAGKQGMRVSMDRYAHTSRRKGKHKQRERSAKCGWAQHDLPSLEAWRIRLRQVS